MISILYENAEIIIIDKPAGLAAQPGAGLRDDVLHALERQVGFRALPVHRLDRETAGCMVLAKNPHAAAEWSEKLAHRAVEKRYFAWVARAPLQTQGIINEPLEAKKGTQRARTLWCLREKWALPHFFLSRRKGSRNRQSR